MNESSNHIIELQNLSIGYKKKTVADGLNAFIDKSEIVSLIGPNGIGKSTLLKTITGELRPKKGDVLIYGKPIEKYSRSQLAHKISLVSTETDSSIGGLRVKELVGLGRDPFTGFFGKLSALDKEIVSQALKSVGLNEKAESYFGNLSDGERQKAMIARVLAQKTPIIILDEPFSFLDPSARIEIFLMLKEEVYKHGKVVILSTHDVSQALRMSDTLWMMGDKSFYISSKTDPFLSDRLKSLYPSDFVEFSNDVKDFVPIIAL